jgi:DNA-binding transcriptional regulator YhcF (GntR family)
MSDLERQSVARTRVEDAVWEAREAGLSDDEIREAVEEALAEDA